MRSIASPLNKVPVILCIDVEPDPRHLEPAQLSEWEGFEATAAFFKDIRPRLEEVTGLPVKFNWFLRLDPQVQHVYGTASWVVQRYVRIIEELERAGDEIGLHTHAFRWDEVTRQWIVDHGDQEWVEHCVRTSFRAYEVAFGRRCRSFRFGDHWMNNETMHLLESLGVQYDLTLEPGIKDKKQLRPDELVTGTLSDYVRTPRIPFRPSRKDFRRNGNGHFLSLWSIPLSTAPRLIIRNGRLKAIHEALSRFRWRHQPLTLNLAYPHPEFSTVLNHLLASKNTCYLAAVVRTDVGAVPELKSNLNRNVQTLISHAQVDRFAFLRPQESMELLQAALLQIT